MAPYDPDFNSDEACPQEIDHYYSASRFGTAQINKISADAQYYRIKSKEAIQKIDCLGVSPGVRQSNERNIHSFNNFRQDSLGHSDLSKPFSIDDVCRWLDALRVTIRLPYDKPIPNGTTIVKAFLSISTYLDFMYPGHRFTHHDTARFRHYYNGLVKDNLVLTGFWYQRARFPFKVVSRMLTTFLNHYLNDGTHSWDVVIAKVLGVTVQSGVGCRSGDVALSRGYEKECLRWSDVTITLHGSSSTPTFADLRGEVLLRFTKGAKLARNEDDLKHLLPLQRHHHLDPLALLLIHALRHGLVHATTLEDLLSHTDRQPGRVLQWKYPDRAVLSAFHNDLSVQVDKPARCQQLLLTVKEVGVISGIMGPVTSHALRRGYIKDVVHIERVGGAVTAVAQQALHHSTNQALSITERYAGEITSPLHSLRENIAESDIFLGRHAKFASTSLLPAAKSKVNQADLQVFLDTCSASERGGYQGVTNASDLSENQRSWLCKVIREQRVKEAAEAAGADRDQSFSLAFTVPATAAARLTRSSTPPAGPSSRRPASPLPPLSASSGKGKSRARSPRSEDEDDVEDDDDDDDDGDDDSGDDEGDDGEDEEDDDNAYDDDGYNDGDEILLDEIFAACASRPTPAEAAAAADRDLDLLLGSGHAANSVEEEEDEEEDDLGAAPPALAEFPSAAAFINFFAKLNVYSQTEVGRAWPKRHELSEHWEAVLKSCTNRGGSRDEPTPFVRFCTKTEGCRKSFLSLLRLRRHEMSCSAKLKAKRQRPALTCPQCGAEIRNGQTKLNRHIRDMHGFTPQRCKIDGCSNTTLFTTKSKLGAHLTQAHHPSYPRRCSHDDCSNLPTHFTQSHTYRSHLGTKHGLEDDAEKAAYMPAKRRRGQAAQTQDPYVLPKRT